MRTLRFIEHISLDGVIQHPADDGDFHYSDWTVPYRTPAGRGAMLAAAAHDGQPTVGRGRQIQIETLRRLDLEREERRLRRWRSDSLSRGRHVRSQ